MTNSKSNELREKVFEIVKLYQLTETYGINPNLPTDAIMKAIEPYLQQTALDELQNLLPTVKCDQLDCTTDHLLKVSTIRGIGR